MDIKSQLRAGAIRKSKARRNHIGTLEQPLPASARLFVGKRFYSGLQFRRAGLGFADAAGAKCRANSERCDRKICVCGL